MPSADTPDTTPASTLQLLGNFRLFTKARPPRDLQDGKPHNNERKKSQGTRGLPGTSSDVITTTTSKQRSPSPSSDRHHARYGRSKQPEVTSNSYSSDSSTSSYVKIVASDGFKERKRPTIPKVPASTTRSKPTRVAPTSASKRAPYTPVAGSSREPQHPPPARRRNITSDLSAARPPNTPVVPGHLQLTDDELRRVQHDLDSHKNELRSTREEIRSANHYIKELHHEKQRWKDNIDGLQHELTSVHKQLEDAKALSEVQGKGKGLFGAQAFLTRGDTLSIPEVRGKVAALNEGILQAAATLGEVLIHQRHVLSQDESDVAAAESQEMVGKKITRLLITQAQEPEPKVNPVLAQVVLQTFIVKFCVSKLQSWYPSDTAIAGFLSAIYSEIHLTEEQTVSGRWRALTCAHTRPSAETWTKELFQKLLSILQTAAWLPDSPANQFEVFRRCLPPIFTAVNELRIAIGENLTSADFDISIFDCGTTYEPSFMEDAYADGREPSGKRVPEFVVGTTGIGLKKLLVERSAMDDLRFQNVIPAKIVLESTLKEALESVRSSDMFGKKKPVQNIDGADQDGRADQVPEAGPSPTTDKDHLVKEELRRVHHELDGYKYKLRRAREEIGSANYYIKELHHEKQRWEAHKYDLRTELNDVRQQLEDIKSLSEGRRGKELSGARVFLAQDDTLSISEVGEKVTALNEEIFQAAATLGEALVHQRHAILQEELDTAVAECQELMGKKISSLLISQAQKPEPKVNPLLAQIVLQIFMVKFCVSKIQSWYPSDTTIAGFLNAIYSEIRSTEEQSVSGRWRALTRNHTRPSTETWTKELCQKLMSVLKIAAWTPGSPRDHESFRHRLPPIFKAVNELRIAIGEKITSADLDISIFDYGKVYDPSFMEDTYDGDGRQPSGKRALRIFGTTGIGLKKLVAECSAMMDDNLQFESVVSAKIVLESTLKKTLEPVESSGSRPKRHKLAVENTDGRD